jgi:hypothetical protein
MASQYTTSLKIQEIGNGEQSGTWGSTTNTNWTLIEQAVAGVQTITMANSNYTLSNLNGTLDEARNAVLVVTGTNSGVYQVIAPLVTKTFIVSNQTTGGYAITIGGASGSVITIPNGLTTVVYCDGTNFYSGITGLTGNQNISGNLSVSGTLGVTGAAVLNGGGTSTTPTTGDNTTKIATTAFVTTAVTNATGTLGTMSTQNANNVTITGGTINGVTGTAAGLVVGSLTATLAPSAGGTGITSVGTSGYALRSTGSAFSMQKLGLGMTGESWQDVTSSRAVATTYTNSNAYPIQVGISWVAGVGQVSNALVGSIVIAEGGWTGYAYGQVHGQFSFIVPPSGTYSIAAVSGNSNVTIDNWAELY